MFCASQRIPTETTLPDLDLAIRDGSWIPGAEMTSPSSVMAKYAPTLSAV